MNALESNTPRATIVMTARERHSLAEAAIDGVVSETGSPFRFIYLDVQSPEWLREIFAARSSEWGLEVVRIDEPLWPQEARQRIVGSIDTEYVVFIDNDVQVEAGWLDALVACADETGAGVVGPLYLWGDGVKPAKVHMAGGRLAEVTTEGRRVLNESPMLVNADPTQIAHQIVRRPCDYVEFHCMLVRTELLRDGSLLDVRIRCVHEHIDLAVEKRVRAYTLDQLNRSGNAGAPVVLSTLSILEAETSAIEAANELDMHLSGECRYSGRSRAVKSHAMQRISYVCEALGVTGLYDSLRHAQQQATGVQWDFVTKVSTSYRIGPDGTSAVPMTPNTLSTLGQDF